MWKRGGEGEICQFPPRPVGGEGETVGKLPPAVREGSEKRREREREEEEKKRRERARETERQREKRREEQQKLSEPILE